MNVDLIEVAEGYADDLIGSCAVGDGWASYINYHVGDPAGKFYGATNVPEDLDDMPEQAIAAIAEIVFECGCCGWYCSAQDDITYSENHDCDVCQDCKADAGDEDE